MKSVMQCSLPKYLVLIMLCASHGAAVTAQDAPGAPVANGVKSGPPPAMPPRRQGGPGGTAGPGPGGPPGERGFPRSGSNMSPLQSEGFERLPEEEKKRVRAAMEKAWSMPALQQAKERYIRANEEFRTAMRDALREVDPEVVKILEKIKPQQQPDARSMPKLPPPSEEGFARAAVERLGSELMAFSRPEDRDKIRAIHLKVMQLPEVAEAVSRLLAAPPDKRVEALGKLRQAYRQALSKEMPNLPRAQERPTAADAPPPSPAAPPALPKP